MQPIWEEFEGIATASLKEAYIVFLLFMCGTFKGNLWWIFQTFHMLSIEMSTTIELTVFGRMKSCKLEIVCVDCVTILIMKCKPYIDFPIWEEGVHPTRTSTASSSWRQGWHLLQRPPPLSVLWWALHGQWWTLQTPEERPLLLPFLWNGW